MRQRESLIDVVGLLLRRRRLLVGVAVAAAAISSIIALFVLPEYFRATTTFLAASPDQTNPTKLFSKVTTVDDFGTGDDLERLIGVATSEETIGFLIDSFNLYTVYDIDSNRADAQFLVRRELEGLYEVVRTRYDAIEIAVEDKSPERAAAIANAARERTSAVIRTVIGQGRGNLALMYSEAINAKERQRRMVSDSLQTLSRRYGIVNVEAQGEGLANLLGSIDRILVGDSARLAFLQTSSSRGRLQDSIAVIGSRLAAARSSRGRIVQQLADFSEGASAVNVLQTESTILDEQLAEDRERLRQINTAGDFGGAVIYLLDRASVPTKKARPVRWLIVLGCTLIALILTSIGLILSDSYKEVEWQQYLRA